MADIVDIAVNNEEMHEAARQQTLKNLRNSKKESLEFCEDCDEAIPEPRRLAIQGCTRCINCQTILERKQKAYSAI